MLQDLDSFVLPHKVLTTNIATSAGRVKSPTPQNNEAAQKLHNSSSSSLAVQSTTINNTTFTFPENNNPVLITVASATTEDPSLSRVLGQQKKPRLKKYRKSSNPSLITNFTLNSEKHIALIRRRLRRTVRNFVPRKYQVWLLVAIWGFLSVCTLCVVYLWRNEIIEFLENFAEFLKRRGIGGTLILFSLIFATTFPLVFGYGTFITMAGFTFGFFGGFIIAYMAALSGAVTVFWLSRRWFRKPVQSILYRNKKMGAVVRAVEKKGFKLLFLIRIAPYPFNVLNALLSATHIPLKTFAAATALSLVKLVIHVWIGSKLSSFSEHIVSNDTNESSIKIKFDLVKMIPVAIGGAIGIGVIIYVWILARRAIREVEEEAEEERGEMRMRLAMGASHQNLLPGDESSEEDEEIDESSETRDGVQQQTLLEVQRDVQRRSSKVSLGSFDII